MAVVGEAKSFRPSGCFTLQASFNFPGLQVKYLEVEEIFVVNITNRRDCCVHSNCAGWQILGHLECPRFCTFESVPNENFVGVIDSRNGNNISVTGAITCEICIIESTGAVR